MPDATKLRRSPVDRNPFRLIRFLASTILFVITGIGAAQYRSDGWTADTGLPQNIIRGISQDHDGYLWIATLNGLARFDGIKFTVYNRSTTSGINSNRFNWLYTAPNGDLWMDTERGGVTRFRNGEFRTFGPSEGVTENRSEGVTGDNAGNVWILSRGRIEQWDEASGKFAEPGLQPHGIQFIRTLWNSGFWGLSGDTFYCFSQGRLSTYALPTFLPGKSLWGAAIDQDGGIWLETFDGKRGRIQPGSHHVTAVNNATEAVTSYHDRRGHQWIVKLGQRLTRTVEYISGGRTVSTVFTKVFEDREFNLWLGTEGQGLLRLQRESIVSYTVDQGLPGPNAYPILEDRDGAVWIGLWNGAGLSRFYEGKFTNFGTANGLPHAPVTALAEDSRKRIWFAMNSGLFTIKDGNITPFQVPTLPSGVVIQAIHEDRSGTMWLGTSLGLFSLRENPLKRITVADGLATDDVRVLMEDKEGTLWIGGYGGLSRLAHDRITAWKEADGLPSNSVRSLYEDRDGTVWVGTYDGGLGRFKDDAFFTFNTQNGLFDNGVFQILEDSQNNLWMSSNRGIFRVSKSDLDGVANQKNGTVFSVAYGKADGMSNVECNGGFSPAGTKTRDGKLWFPNQAGVVVVDPNLVISNPQPPPVVIEATMLNRVLRPGSGPVQVRPGQENVSILYTALSFISSSQIRFKYRLEGLDSDWVEAGDRRIAYYSHIPPGHYVFHVIAVNRDGVWNSEGKRLQITVLAPFYQTWSFTILAAVLVATLVGFAWYRRGLSYQRAQQVQQAFSQQLISSQESERRRIAGDLHDSIGQRLVVINNLALMSLRSIPEQSDRENLTTVFEEIGSEAELAIREAREISYDLRPFQLDRLGLTKGILGILRSVTSASQIKIDSQVDDLDDFFPDELRINLYRIVQESTNNILKHAGATEIVIRASRQIDTMVLTIRDNGRGFSPSTSSSETDLNGSGLTGMEQRALLLGGKLEIVSVLGQGTTVRFEARKRAL